MPPKSNFTRDDIIEAAFQVIRKHGRTKLSTRAIAKELRASTMPIYSVVNSVTELEPDVHRKYRQLFLEYSMRSWTGNALLDLAFGFIRFAKDEKQLFRIMFSTDDAEEVAIYKEEQKIVEPLLRERVKAHPDFAAFSDEQIQQLMNFMGIFMQGLANLVNDGRLDDDSDEQILKTLTQAYHAFVRQIASLPQQSSIAQEDSPNDRRNN